MHVDQFRQSMKVANLAAGLCAATGIALSVLIGAVLVGTVLTLAFAFTLHGVVYAAQCRRRVGDIRHCLTGPRRDDGPNGMGVVSHFRPTGDIDLDFHLDVYASMRHGHRQFFTGLGTAMLTLCVIWLLLAI